MVTPTKKGVVLIKILVGFVVVIIGLIGGFIYLIANEKPTQLVPLDNKGAEYRLNKCENINRFCLNYKADKDDWTLWVYESKVPLDDWLGKNVKIEGEFVEITVEGKNGGKSSWIGLDIDSIRSANNE